MINGDNELKMTIYIGLAIHSVVFNVIWLLMVWLLMEENPRHDHRRQNDDDQVDGEVDDEEGDEREGEERIPLGARTWSNLVRR